jgi:hypothetical protein
MTGCGSSSGNADWRRRETRRVDAAARSPAGRRLRCSTRIWLRLPPSPAPLQALYGGRWVDRGFDEWGVKENGVLMNCGCKLVREMPASTPSSGRATDRGWPRTVRIANVGFQMSPVGGQEHACCADFSHRCRVLVHDRFLAFAFCKSGIELSGLKMQYPLLRQRAPTTDATLSNSGTARRGWRGSARERCCSATPTQRDPARPGTGRQAAPGPGLGLIRNVVLVLIRTASAPRIPPPQLRAASCCFLYSSGYRRTVPCRKAVPRWRVGGPNS